MTRFTDLDELLDHIWNYAEKGISRRENAMATPAFATAGPNVRTVIPRNLDPTERAIDFHTDIRSKKIQELESNPRAMWLAWDKKISQQFQFKGEVSVHRNDEIADSLWDSDELDDLVFYFKKVSPADPLPEPGSGIDIYEIEEDEARKNFAVLRTTIDEIIWQHLHPEGEYRARFVWDGQKFTGSWIVP